MNNTFRQSCSIMLYRSITIYATLCYASYLKNRVNFNLIPVEGKAFGMSCNAIEIDTDTLQDHCKKITIHTKAI